MNRTKKAWINLLFLGVTLAVNAMGALGVFNGLSQKEISDKYMTLITPSPSTFGIWSVIYSLLILSMIVMIIKHDDYYYLRAIDQTSALYRFSCLLNMAWIITFSYLWVELSVLFILGFVITLALIGLRLLGIHEAKRWLLPVTFGMYGGWLFIATVVNTAAALVKQDWNGFGLGQDTWAIIMLAVAIVLVLGVVLKLRNAVFPLPIAWAYYGIHQFLKSPTGFDGQYATLELVALAGAAVLVLMAILLFVRNRFSILPKARV